MAKESNKEKFKKTAEEIVKDSAMDQSKSLLSSAFDYLITSPLKTALFGVIGIGSVGGAAGYAINQANKPSESNLELKETAVIIEESKKIAKLFSTSYYTEIVIDTNKVIYDTSSNYTNMITNLFHDDEHQEKSFYIDSNLFELTIIAHGTAYAGNDLSQISSKNIIITDSSCTINISTSKILSTVINPSDFTIFIDEGEWSPDEVQEIKAIAVKKVESYGIRNGILEKANARTKKMLTEFLKSLGFETINVNFIE